jgi:beta-lactam-binding protein with PASTA domain
MKGYVHIGFIIVIAVVVVLLLLFAFHAGPWHVATPKVVGTPL